MTIEDILKKALDGQRVTLDEGVHLYHEADLFDLGIVADELNLRKNPSMINLIKTLVVSHSHIYVNIVRC